MENNNDNELRHCFHCDDKVKCIVLCEDICYCSIFCAIQENSAIFTCCNYTIETLIQVNHSDITVKFTVPEECVTCGGSVCVYCADYENICSVCSSD